MKYRELGKTGLKVSCIGFGGGVLNIKKDPLLNLEKVQRILSSAADLGVNLLDIGKEYDEEIVATAVGANKERMVIVTRSTAEDKETLLEDIRDSLNKLGLEVIPIYEVWSYNDQLVEGLREAKKQGLIQFSGIFSHRVDVLEGALQTGGFDVITLLYNTVHRAAERLFKYTKEHGIGVIDAAPMATGILVDSKTDITKTKPAAKYMTAENALKFVLSQDAIHSSLVGSKNFAHIKNNAAIGSREWNLSPEELEEIVKRTEDFLGSDFCRMCRYCGDCPHGVPIPDLFKLNILIKYGYIDFAQWQYNSHARKADICMQCSECSQKCHYGIPIREKLIELHNHLT